ncbi:MAG TPA: glycosyltransferase family 2 protein [Candidatus Eremiobacteraceae bacterium]|nr:glycosyltransferase family 2 protein [Candidatus Eremiobacteraceae bacterium]
MRTLGAVTAIIPTYQRPQMLRRALSSVLRQTIPNVRVCVYDNASGGETESVVKAFASGDARVQYFRHDRNIGAMANFLFGMRRVETPYFSFLSDDDVLLPDFYETALSGFARQPDALMSAASTVEVDEAGRPLFEPLALWPREGIFEPPSGAFAMLDNRHPTWTTVLFRREAIDRIGYLDLDVGAPSDLDFELHLAACAPIVVSKRVCGAYVRHADAHSVGETAEVATGFARICRKIDEDTQIETDTRKKLAARVLRQLRMKLVEVWVKGLVRGDDAVARDAALAMRDRYGPRLGGSLLLGGWRAIIAAAPLRALLRIVENTRLGRRAAAARSIEPARLRQIRETLAL